MCTSGETLSPDGRALVVTWERGQEVLLVSCDARGSCSMFLFMLTMLLAEILCVLIAWWYPLPDRLDTRRASMVCVIYHERGSKKRDLHAGRGSGAGISSRIGGLL